MISVNTAHEIWNSILQKPSRISHSVAFELYKEISKSGTTEMERAYLLAKKVEEYLNKEQQ